MKKKLLILLLAATVITLPACIARPSASKSSGVTVSEKEEEEDDEDDAKEKEKEEPKKKESEVGKRSNPVPLGQVATFSSNYYDEEGEEIEAVLAVSVSNIQRGEEVYNYIMEANQFNEAAPEGYEWMSFDVSLKVVEGSEDDPYYASESFKVISSSGSEVDQQSTYASLPSGEEFGYVDLYEGGEVKGKVAKIVPVGDDVLLQFDDWNASVFFAIK